MSERQILSPFSLISFQEQKILCCLSISKDVATVRCLNCDQDVYTFQPSSTSVNLESTSLAFLASSVLFSPSNGIVMPSDVVVTGSKIDDLVHNVNYSKAFRLILEPIAPSATGLATDQATSSPGPLSAPQQHEYPYRPHLEKVRAILEKELEANLNAQQLRTEARIEAYKSQQLLALRQSVENTRREKECLWAKIQVRVSSPPPPTTALGTVELGNAGASGVLSAGSGDPNNGLHPFDGPSTLPIRLTSASRVDGPHSSFLDRRDASVSDMAVSLQFREFDQRMASNSLRRQSLVSAHVEKSKATDDTADLTSTNTAANATTSSAVDQTSSSASNSGTSSPTGKSKKKVTISDAIKRVSIVEPESNEYADIHGLSDEDDEDDEEEEEGVVFDLDEELGFHDEGHQNGGIEDGDSEDDAAEKDDEEDELARSKGKGIAINNSHSRSVPKSGMVVGSLRASYLRRQRGLQQHKQLLTEDDLDFDEYDDENEDDGDRNTTSAAAYLGTSLPIQIQLRSANFAPPPPVRTSALTTSLAMPPSSTPAAAMLQRRLSRAYGPDILSENSNQSNVITGAARSSTPVSYAEGPALMPPVAGTMAGSVIIDPLMLLEEEHDNDDREDRLRKHRQPFSSINHRRDLEKSKQNQDIGDFSSSLRANRDGSATPTSVARLGEFEPPHLFSARTYVGSTPWEMPTRITVKSGGMQREGTHLDKEIALEMAKELEKERQEQEREAKETLSSSSAQRTVHKIDEADEGEEDQQEESDVLPQYPVSTATAEANGGEGRSDS
ncbi:hypothetical protein EDD21DRAFT_365723 [Dissophora ornata]|nr:hypothetical protein EDD21DRAFT_365723 [Dissophora ornata]